MRRKMPWREVLFVGIVSVVAFLAFSLFEFGASGSMEENSSEMIVRDTLKPGEHHLSGTIVLPSACESFTVRTTQLDTFRYHLTFETWREPQRDCEDIPVSRPFQTVVFAPAFGVSFTADIGGVPLPFTIIPSIVN